MAIRNIREYGDEVLNQDLQRGQGDDTPDQRTDRGYVGDYVRCQWRRLAAPQVGVLKRIVVIDTTGEDPYILINPRIVESSGEQTGQEGCLSVPGKFGIVTRPNYVKAVALDDEYEAHRSRGNRIAGQSHLPRTGSSGRSSLCGKGGRTAAGYDLRG